MDARTFGHPLDSRSRTPTLKGFGDYCVGGCSSALVPVRVPLRPCQWLPTRLVGMGASPSRRSLLLFLFRWRWERGGLAVGLGVLLRSLVLLGHVDVLDQRRVVQDLTEPFVVSAARLPPGDDHRGH